MLDQSVGLPFTFNYSTICSRVALVRSPQLMVPYNIIILHLLPLRSPYVVLSTHQRVADETHMAHDVEKLVTWHGLPKMAVDISVIDL